MSTDESMDARLQAAGERWRAVNEPLAASTAVVPDSAVHELTDSARKRRNRWSYLATAAAVLVVGGGAAALVVTSGNSNPGPGGPGQDLVGTPWTLTGIVDQNGAKLAVPSKATLFIGSDGTLAGRDGCNMLSGLVKVTATSIELQGSGIATTEIGCLDPATSAEAAAVDRVLAASGAGAPALSYSVTGDQLTLTRAGEGTLTYRANVDTQSTNPADLVGKWTLSGIEETSGDSSSASGSSDDSIIKVTFDGNGHITIAHQCYTNAGSADIGSGTIDISGVTLSQALPCPSTEANAMQAENETVDAVLSGRVTWKINDGQLTITKGDRALDLIKPGSSTSSATPTGPDALLGTWTLSGYSTGGGRTSHTTSPTAPYRLAFYVDGKFTVTAVNGGADFAGTYKADRSSMVVTTSGVAPQGCPVEHQLVTGLRSGPFWVVKGDTMSLILGDTLRLDFVKGATGTGAGQGC